MGHHKEGLRTGDFSIQRRRGTGGGGLLHRGTPPFSGVQGGYASRGQAEGLSFIRSIFNRTDTRRSILFI